MAKIACAKCGNQIDNFALTCPLCGVRTARGMMEDGLKSGAKRMKGVKTGIIFLIVAGCFWFLWQVLGSYFGNYGDVSKSPAGTAPPSAPATTDIPVR